MINGGPLTQLTMRQRKREHREIFAARMAVPQYLNWSNTPITFDHDDHPDRVVAPGVYPLIVDPIIVNTQLSKVLMDGGSSLNIIYLESLDTMVSCLGRRRYQWVESICRSVSAQRSTSGRRPSLSKWWVFEALTTPSLGAQDMPSLW